MNADKTSGASPPTLRKMWACPATTMLTCIGSATGSEVHHETLNVFFSGTLRISLYKLLDACTIELTKSNSPHVTIPLEQYMELCGKPTTKPSKDKTRRKLQEDLKCLESMSLEWTETSRGKTHAHHKTKLCDYGTFYRGTIIFQFSTDMAKHLSERYLMQYPIELLQIDERNPNAYHIGRKLMIHNSMPNNRSKGTADLLSVKSLLESCPYIPTYAQVLETGRQLEQRIKTPLENALDSLPFIRWEYCNSKGVQLTEDQLRSIAYADFEKLLVRFTIIEGVGA